MRRYYKPNKVRIHKITDPEIFNELTRQALKWPEIKEGYGRYGTLECLADFLHNLKSNAIYGVLALNDYGSTTLVIRSNPMKVHKRLESNPLAKKQGVSKWEIFATDQQGAPYHIIFLLAANCVLEIRIAALKLDKIMEHLNARD